MDKYLCLVAASTSQPVAVNGRTLGTGTVQEVGGHRGRHPNKQQGCQLLILIGDIGFEFVAD
jgi:hypothetical protein